MGTIQKEVRWMIGPEKSTKLFQAKLDKERRIDVGICSSYNPIKLFVTQL